MFKVDDDAEETPHIIPGGTNDTGEAMTFSEHLHVKHPSDLDENSDEDDSDGEEDEAAVTPLI